MVSDLNGHVGSTNGGTHGGYGYGARNADGSRILESADGLNIVIGNTLFMKQKSKLYLLPASLASIFNPLDHRELCSHCCHQCLRRPDCTSSQVRCVPSQPDRSPPSQPDRPVTQSIATLLLSQAELTV